MVAVFNKSGRTIGGNAAKVFVRLGLAKWLKQEEKPVEKKVEQIKPDVPVEKWQEIPLQPIKPKEPRMPKVVPPKLKKSNNNQKGRKKK